jgi:hypothetical protein
MKTFRQLREQLVLIEAAGTNQKGWINYKTSAAKVLEKVLSVSSTLEFDKNREVSLHGAVGSTSVRVTDRFAWKTFLTTGKMVKQKSALAAFR